MTAIKIQMPPTGTIPIGGFLFYLNNFKSYAKSATDGEALKPITTRDTSLLLSNCMYKRKTSPQSPIYQDISPIYLFYWGRNLLTPSSNARFSHVSFFRKPSVSMIACLRSLTVTPIPSSFAFLYLYSKPLTCNSFAGFQKFFHLFYSKKAADK